MELDDPKLHGITHCITMRIPKESYQDAILSLEVCIDEESQPFFRNLFEPSWKDTRKLRDISIYIWTYLNWTNIGSEVTSILAKASVPTIPEIGPRIDFAVEKSQLRKWEKEYTYKYTTGCLLMEINTRGGYGILHLRIGFVISTHIANQLYSFKWLSTSPKRYKPQLSRAECPFLLPYLLVPISSFRPRFEILCCRNRNNIASFRSSLEEYSWWDVYCNCRRN